MKDEELRGFLAKLNAEIQKLSEKDSDARKKLERLTKDIQGKLDDPANQEHHDRLLEQLRESTVKFEASHPLITGILQKLIDTLVRLGV